jgi:hypothetical protein
MIAPAPLLHVRDWAARFENHRTRELRSLTWIPESTDLGSDTYAAILDHPDGAAHFGVMVGIHIAAAKGIPRGYLRREDGRPHDGDSLARLLRMPAPLVKSAISRLIDLGDLEVEKKNSRKSKAVASRNGAETSRDCAELRGNPAPEQKGTEQKGIELKEEKENPSDNSDASHKNRSKAPEWASDVPSEKNKNPKQPTHTDEEHAVLREGMARHYNNPVGRMGELECPPDSVLTNTIAKLRSGQIPDFLKYVNGQRLNRESKPRSWPWYVTVAAGYAEKPILQKPTQDRCRHNLPYGACCNDPAIDNSYGDSFSTLDDLEGAA